MRGEIMTNIQAISRWPMLAVLAYCACDTPMVVDSKASSDARAGSDAQDSQAQRDAGSALAAATDAATSQPSAAGSGGGGGGVTTTGHSAAGSDAKQAGQGGASPASSAGQAGQAAKPAAPNPNAVAACQGKPSAYACDATTLYHCDGNGAYDRKTGCTTAGECSAGLTTGSCGSCDPGQFRCTGAILEKCSDSGSWAMSDTCASAELCMADAGACMAMACATGDYRCMGDELQTCNQTLTDFEAKTTCDAGLCNAADKRCNECMPDSKTCAGATTLIVCSADGEQMQQPCTSDTPFCATDQCVQCTTDQDCAASAAASGECGTLACVGGSCSAGLPKPPETACSQADASPGVCDLSGSCVACITDADCGDSSKRCNPLNLITPCETRNPLEVVAALGGGYTVTVAPGYTLSVKRDDGADSVGVTENFFTTYCAGPTNPCSISSSANTRSLMFSSPSLTAPCGLPLPTDFGAGDEADLMFGADLSTTDGGVASCNVKIELVATATPASGGMMK
jgi:hypothetical protein